MKKIITALFLALAVIITSATVFAVDNSYINTADALNELGLFLGTGNGYELEKGLTRAEGVTLLVRMIGKEETAQNSVYENDFTDVPEWAAGYIGYAFENGITDGTGATTFSPDDEMTDYMFLTLVLRALDYFDKGEEPLFVWDDPYELAHGLKLIKSEEPDTKFTRADAIEIFWNALDVNLHSSDMTLAERLIEQKVFTARELAEAREIKEYGREENVGVPVIPTPDTDAPETDAPETDAPETDAPDTDAPETDAPETDAPETDAPETDAPETDAPETDAPETDAPETDASETDAPETDAPETDAPEIEAPETEAPEVGGGTILPDDEF